ncbi:glycosyltransferase [Dactylosporangium sp. CA-092794]|uniref:glycosyltransferase n=1 Tax=Dactylosporangium sp. CA-092794 TaxID=3239929 RepID=UPI003D905E5D
MTRLLFVSVPLLGHVTPLREVGAEMVLRGHDVTFLTHEVFGPSIEAAGMRFVSFAGDAAVHPSVFAEEQGRYAPGPAAAAVPARL